MANGVVFQDRFYCIALARSEIVWKLALYSLGYTPIPMIPKWCFPCIYTMGIVGHDISKHWWFIIDKATIATQDYTFANQSDICS